MAKKQLVLFFLAFIFLQSSWAYFFMSQKFAEVREECLSENSMTMDELHEGWKMENLPESHLCFLKCLLEKREVIDENGVPQKEKIDEILTVKQLSDEKREEISTCITNVEKIENCETMSEIMRCFPKKRRD
ncbi:odorant binding protein 05 [Tribolium castaneum]|uniref:Odorant binding protein 05 n=1 Tax=Tribolium castaneum TaxID=7070 RepID=D2A671_TRICA|nr:PREDICTED: general odorant-binding protein 57c [Tribolium castaneum]EFA05677.1 odorant binding protein 05 [Tribolium castaneum]|eukprot:XP_015836450.1 PREDICTED: general odorant-binding protein 57c [Tribolium castaneum]